MYLELWTTVILNLSLSTGTFPTKWKCARITPILKSSDPSLPKNYRPISILPIVSKVLERYLHSVVLKHLSDNAPISKYQWGFMPHRSTTSALCTMTHNWLQELDNGNEICSVFFDLRKAFDSVPHNQLLEKLASLNICPYILHWIHSYLSDRSQVVAISGEQSSARQVVSGVPQGSVMGPLLFTIYIDDVTSQISPSSSISLFADDIALYRCIQSPADYVILQADITNIAILVEEKMHLKFNTDKCSVLFISRKRSLSITPPSLFINADNPIKQVNSVKYLGVILTSDLSWTEHITRVCTKTRKLIGLLYRRFHHCSPDLITKLYKSFIRPHLEYVPHTWDPYLVKDIVLLEKTQKFALKVCSKNWSASYTELLEFCHISTLSKRRRVAKLCHLYKIMFGLTDCHLIPVTVRTLNYSSRKKNPLQLQHMFAQSSQLQYSFYPHTISLWNDLSLANGSLSSISTFKLSLM